ncbi:U-box domain-containing protein 21 [Apostasia shenzhenica]|uniref:U-box domain-containing protein n=1 Tax=Apostasia shenzhenica TaxID=1088818 RepID=A0A2I0AJ84_9ASPA|nr:U-box domain-containing protein 21 [Apostasia shenzhenica]
MPLRSLKPKTKFSFRRRSMTTAPGSSPAELSIPTHFLCPISLDLMKDPVTLPTGITYDRQSIETWLDAGNTTCPVTNQSLVFSGDGDIIPNHAIRRMIQGWCVFHKSHGVDRIPTPKIPITSLQVAEALSEIAVACRRRDEDRCLELVEKIKTWAAESERNRRCITSNGVTQVLAAAFRDFPTEQILSAIAGFLTQADREIRKQLASPESLAVIVSILRSGNLSGRINAAVVVKEIVADDSAEASVIARTEGLIGSLVKLVKEPISPQATKAALVAAYYLVSSGEAAAARFAEMGLVTILLEMLVDCEKSFCEKGLAVLDGILSSEVGREKAAGHSLAVPVLVKKMMRVSDMATEFAVSAIWRLCRKEKKNGGGGCLTEALQAGAFQKLLLLLQVGCGEGTKEKASELLKMMNGLRGKVECIESMDFKGIKRQF